VSKFRTTLIPHNNNLQHAAPLAMWITTAGHGRHEFRTTARSLACALHTSGELAHNGSMPCCVLLHETCPSPVPSTQLDLASPGDEGSWIFLQAIGNSQIASSTQAALTWSHQRATCTNLARLCRCSCWLCPMACQSLPPHN
jgi:hypothetical protein